MPTSLQILTIIIIAQLAHSLRFDGTGQVNDAKCFLHIGTTGADYETKSQYTFTVTGTDNVNTPTTSSP